MDIQSPEAMKHEHKLSSVASIKDAKHWAVKNTSMRRVLAISVSLSVSTAALVSTPVLAQVFSQPDTEVITTSRCKALATNDFSDVLDAPTQVMAAEVLKSNKGEMPAYCRVLGYVSPAVGFELRLPVSQWNGKFLEVGCGGFCGLLASAEWGACDDALRRGYACLSSDLGHKSTFEDAKWAFNAL